MSLFSRKDGSENKTGGVNVPSYDPYGQYQNSGSGIFGFRKDNHVVIPGVTSYEEDSLRKVKDYVEKETGKPCTLSQELMSCLFSNHLIGNKIKNYNNINRFD